MFEHRTTPIISFRAFLLRLARSAAVGLGIVAASLFVGMLGYHFLEDLSWVDAFANAAMILSGMGPLSGLKTASGKIFAGCYALYSGLVLILVIGIIYAPVVHRFLHHFHLKMNEQGALRNEQPAKR